jgi:hypothetical protein
MSNKPVIGENDEADNTVEMLLLDVVDKSAKVDIVAVA